MSRPAEMIILASCQLKRCIKMHTGNHIPLQITMNTCPYLAPHEKEDHCEHNEAHLHDYDQECLQCRAAVRLHSHILNNFSTMEEQSTTA